MLGLGPGAGAAGREGVARRWARVRPQFDQGIEDLGVVKTPLYCSCVRVLS